MYIYIYIPRGLEIKTVFINRHNYGVAKCIMCYGRLLIRYIFRVKKPQGILDNTETDIITRTDETMENILFYFISFMFAFYYIGRRWKKVSEIKRKSIKFAICTLILNDHKVSV